MDATALVYILLTALTIGFALLTDQSQVVTQETGLTDWSRQKLRNNTAYFAIFCLMAGVSACRIAVGNDYWVYRNNFELIAQSRHVSSEIGFNLLVWWMQDWFGYSNYLPVFALFSLLTVFFFLKALRGQADWFAASIFLLMTNGYYFSSLNNIRYYLALAMAMWSMEYVLRREYGKFLFIIVLASTFHKTVLLVIPVYYLASRLADIQLKKRHIVLISIFSLSLVLGQRWYEKIMFWIYPYYQNSAFDVSRISWINVAKCAGTLFLAFMVYGKAIPGADRKQRFYYFLTLGGLILYCFASYIPEISRIGYYLITSQIFWIPQLLRNMKNTEKRKFFTIVTALAFVGYFAIFLLQSYDTNIRLLPYRNWIFQ
jgi:hypothetical protein